MRNMSLVHSPLSPPVGRLVRSPLGFRRGGSRLVFPLDVAGALPESAYGIAQLTATYSGPAIRVFRPSDSGERDIYFKGQFLDAGDLADFLGTQVGKVMTFYDIRGNGRHITQATDASRAQISVQVTMSGGLSVAFNGVGEYPLPAALSLDRRSSEVIGVVEFPTSKEQNGLFEIGATSNAAMNIFTQSAGSMQWRPTGGAVAFKTQAAPRWYNVYGSATGGYFEQDGETSTAAAPTSLVSTGGYLGRIIPGGYTARMLFGFIAYYARVLSAGERAAAKAAADKIFNCVSTGGVLVANGDSIMASSTAGTLRNGIINQLLPSLATKPKVFNFAGGGEKIYNNLTGGAADFANYEALILSRYSAEKRVIFYFKGTNDMGVDGRTGAQAYADLQTYCGLARSAGAKVIVCTLLPRTSYGLSNTTEFAAFNTSVRTNWATFADGFVDFNQHPVMGAGGAAADSSLYLDGLHPTMYGNSLLAAYAAAEVNRVIALP
jgi:hypothetical protein